MDDAKMWLKLSEKGFIFAVDGTGYPSEGFCFGMDRENFKKAFPIIKAELRKEFLKEFDLICGWCDGTKEVVQPYDDLLCKECLEK